jgi:uncharacterized glyoxalase superfamily metalloenzyme YdcJ
MTEQTLRERAEAFRKLSQAFEYEPQESEWVAQKLIDTLDVLDKINDICYGKVKHINHHARILAIIDEVQHFHEGGDQQ